MCARRILNSNHRFNNQEFIVGAMYQFESHNHFWRLPFTVDWMTVEDLFEVVQIEDVSGLNRWGYDTYRRELLTNPRALMLAARTHQNPGRGVIGFFVGATVEDEMHVNNVATHPSFRRMGVGRALLQVALEHGARRGITFAVLEVRASNEAAQTLYKNLGFRFVHRRRDYYSFPTEDAFIMRYDLYSSDASNEFQV